MSSSSTPYTIVSQEDNEKGSSLKFKSRFIILGLAVSCVIAATVFVFFGMSSQGNHINASSSLSGAVSSSSFSSSGRVVSSSSSGPEDIYRTAGCPFSRWFNNLPSNFGIWGNNMENKYEGAWKAACSNPSGSQVDPSSAGCPLGFDKNDHNYQTVLGQGNTLGFLAGNFKILDSIPQEVQHGLLAKVGQTFPTIFRFSDFGDDSSKIRLARLAFKIPFGDEPGECSSSASKSWYNEFNMLFTESLDTFPLANYDDISVFAGSPDVGLWSKFTSSLSFLKVLFRNGYRFYRDSSKGILAKEYYTQLPYQLGCDKAMKIKVTPIQPSCSDNNSKDVCCVPTLTDNSKQQMALGVASFISKCGAQFDVSVQYKTISSRTQDVIMRQAATGWDEEFIQVGVLSIPPQQVTDQSTATSDVLKQSLSESLSLSDSQTSGAHKLFMFHPILTSDSHRPLGEVNSFRSNFYAQHTQSRYETILSKVFKDSSDPKPPYKVPFGQWKKSSSSDQLTKLFGGSN
eukprot:c33512_g1_i1.p1 GENE.c33512_g1_i1~~c33512_g1_i1.p1  ORF type:complete len:514 (-),score=257.57 c33512_g1_i1:42-1583(-)